MATNKKLKENPIATALTISRLEFKQKISERINAGEDLSNRNLTTNAELTSVKQEYNLWNDYNKEFLKQVFNVPENEYKRAYTDAGYTPFGPLGEIDGNPAQSLKNLISNKLISLKSLHSKADLFKSETNTNDAVSNKVNDVNKTQVFIVHGHDEEAKAKTARFIQKLGFLPIILHEQSSSGRTIIEKIEEYSNVGFGIVLYTQCDIGAKKGEEKNLNFRARQNVVFEHGYLIGKIGRSNVCALVKGDIETPNDISGVVFVKMDDDDAWHLKIVRELRSSGYEVDLNKL
jgi:predicted nucleotide-binding protein